MEERWILAAMRDLKGKVVLLTGASRGIGVYVARLLAARGARLALVARSAQGLSDIARELKAAGHDCTTFAADVGDRRALEQLVKDCEAALGPIEVLVNNAGIEHMSMYEHMPLDEVEQFIDINLRGPMLLTRLVLPGMLARDAGHIVNVSSLAGLGPTAFAEPYGATKHGLVGFSRALRASLKTRGSKVSASCVCPGFVSGAGMFEDNRKRTGIEAPKTLGTFPVEGVARAVVEAIENDAPEVIVNGRPIRPLLALGILWPRVMEWMTRVVGANDALYGAAKADAALRKTVLTSDAQQPRTQ